MSASFNNFGKFGTKYRHVLFDFLGFSSIFHFCTLLCFVFVLICWFFGHLSYRRLICAPAEFFSILVVIQQLGFRDLGWAFSLVKRGSHEVLA